MGILHFLLYAGISACSDGTTSSLVSFSKQNSYRYVQMGGYLQKRLLGEQKLLEIPLVRTVKALLSICRWRMSTLFYVHVCFL